MKLDTKTISVLAVVVLFALLWGARFSFRRPAPPPKEAANPYSAFVPPGGGAMPDMSKLAGDQAKIYELMTQRGLDIHLATYISQAKFQLISATDTSLHYVLTFPDNLTSDETITIKPNQQYRPTPAELQRPSQSGIRIFKPTLTFEKKGPKRVLFTLHYFALQNSLPTDVQQWIQKISANSPPSGAHFFSLIPSAWAQEGGGNGAGGGNSEGGGITEAVATEIIKTSDVEMLEHLDVEHGGEILEAFATFLEMKKSYDKMDGWMNEMKELEDCAKNPTNPLTIKASKNPEYQKEVLDPVNSATSDVASAAFPILSNLTASAVPQFSKIPGLGVIIAPIIALNDETIDQITEDRIHDARKSVVPCEQDDTPGAKGSLEYSYKRKINMPGNIQDVDGTAEGTFIVKKAPGHTLYAGEGEGKLEWNETQKTYINQKHAHTSGPLTIWMNGQGDGTITANFNGENLTYTYACSGGCNNNYHETDKHNFTRGCEFHNVDMENGGVYEVEAPSDGTGAKETCKLTLPKQ
jgi:hypothetical protein